MLFLRAALVAAVLLLVACQKAADPRLEPVDQAIERGFQFLQSRQVQDGKWISQRYPIFKDGFTLTPLVGATFVRGGRDADSVQKARTFMRAMPSAARDKLIFPAYAVAEALVLCGPDSSSQEARSEWVQFLQARQMTETLGWSPTDPSYGGWAETNQVYARPAPGRRMDVSRLADLSTTLFVVSGLRASQVAVDDPAIQKARGFVERCQNFEPPTGGTRDGGFFFCPGGRNRNKAGEFQSYGSTSADGIRALLLCGTPASDARVKAARRWLVSHFDANQNAGNFPKNKETVRQALYYYYCASLAVALQESGMVGDDVTWARSLCDTLLRKQKADGSWSNPVPVYCEDEPVLATLFALRSLMAARKTLADAPAR